MVKIGFIGMGNMGNTILNGLLETHGLEEMIFSVAHQGKMEVMTVRIKVFHACSNRERTEAVRYLILAVKPQHFDAVPSEIRDVVIPKQVVVPPTPGIIISSITERLGGDVRVVRAMSNMPAMLGEDMTDVSHGKVSYIEEEKETVRDIFSSCGRVELVEERLMDTVGCISGSSPAFVYMFTEALADGGVKYGPPRKTVYAMAAQTMLGNAKMILEIGKHSGQLGDEVCSPDGTTIADVSVLEGYDLRDAVVKATDACYEKTWRMKQDNDIKSQQRRRYRHGR